LNYKELAIKFKELLDAYKSVTIISHIRPDGDTIGSSLALFNSLKLMGYQVEIVCKDVDLPFKFNFLKGFDKYKKRIDFNNSLVVTLDCADINRTGFDLSSRDIVNIDHHKSNTKFGILNIVEVEVSTTAVLFKLLKEGFRIDVDVANALYTGLLTDSINFTTSLVDRSTFIMASELIEFGVSPSFIAQMVTKRNSLAHTRLIARAIDSLELFSEGRVAFMIIDNDDMKVTGAKISDIDGIIDFGINLVTVEIAILLSDINGVVKASLRSKNKDVSKIAIDMGGGGHKNAAGFEVLNGKIELIKEQILVKIEDILCEE